MLVILISKMKNLSYRKKLNFYRKFTEKCNTPKKQGFYNDISMIFSIRDISAFPF